jgi:hypothetical protein
MAANHNCYFLEWECKNNKWVGLVCDTTLVVLSKVEKA